jgi:hypothetical protein
MEFFVCIIKYQQWDEDAGEGTSNHSRKKRKKQ